MWSREGLGWLSGDGRERRVELGATVPMATGRSSSGSTEGACVHEVAGLPFYRRRALDGATDGPAVHGGRPTDEGEHSTWQG
jgi:hypothetical protein